MSKMEGNLVTINLTDFKISTAKLHKLQNIVYLIIKMPQLTSSNKTEMLTFKMLLLSYSFCQMDYFFLFFFFLIANYLVTACRPFLARAKVL